jgi:hypothetical protein
VIERLPGARIATSSAEWTWIAAPVPVSTSACAEGSVTRPAGVGTATRAVLATGGREQLVVAREARCCPNEARHTVRLRASLGPMLFVEEADFSFECGAHGSTDVAFFVWDAERAARLDVLGEVPHADRLKAAVAKNVVGAAGSLVPDEGTAEITALVPTFRPRDVALEAQISLPACYACSDGAWSSYTRSVRVPAEAPPMLAPWLALPEGVVAFRRGHPDTDVRGWSRIPHRKP